MRNGCPHHVVAPARIHVEGNLAVWTDHGAIDNCVHAFSRAEHVIGRSDVHAPELVRRLDGQDVGDAQRMLVFESAGHVGPQTRCAAEDQDVHASLPELP